MKAGIHPDYVEATITCACGEVIHTRSTRPVLRIEICSKCHPYFTGKQKLVDTAGRVERFEKKYAEVAEDLERRREKERQAKIEAAKEKARAQMAEREERKRRLAERQRKKAERASTAKAGEGLASSEGKPPQETGSPET